MCESSFSGKINIALIFTTIQIRISKIGNYWVRFINFVWGYQSVPMFGNPRLGERIFAPVRRNKPRSEG